MSCSQENKDLVISDSKLEDKLSDTSLVQSEIVGEKTDLPSVFLKYEKEQAWLSNNKQDFFEVFSALESGFLKNIQFMPLVDKDLIKFFFKSTFEILSGDDKTQKVKVSDFFVNLVGEACIKTLLSCSHLSTFSENFYFSRSLALVSELSHIDANTRMSIAFVAYDTPDFYAKDDFILDRLLSLIFIESEVNRPQIKKTWNRFLSNFISRNSNLNSGLNNFRKSIISEYLRNMPISEFIRFQSNSYYNNIKLSKSFGIFEAIFSQDKIFDYVSSQSYSYNLKIKALNSFPKLLNIVGLEKDTSEGSEPDSIYFTKPYIILSWYLSGRLSQDEFFELIQNFSDDEIGKIRFLSMNIFRSELGNSFYEIFNEFKLLLEENPLVGEESFEKFDETLFNLDKYWLNISDKKNKTYTILQYLANNEDSSDTNSLLNKNISVVDSIEDNFDVLVNIPISLLIGYELNRLDAKLNIDFHATHNLLKGLIKIDPVNPNAQNVLGVQEKQSSGRSFVKQLFMGESNLLFKLGKMSTYYWKDIEGSVQTTNGGKVSLIQLAESILLLSQSGTLDKMNISPEQFLTFIFEAFIGEDFNKIDSSIRDISEVIFFDREPEINRYLKHCSYLADYYCENVSNQRNICVDKVSFSKQFPNSAEPSLPFMLSDLTFRTLFGLPRTLSLGNQYGASIELKSAFTPFNLPKAYINNLGLENAMDGFLDDLKLDFFDKISFFNTLIESLYVDDTSFDKTLFYQNNISSKVTRVTSFLESLTDLTNKLDPCIDFLTFYERKIANSLFALEKLRANKIYSLYENDNLLESQKFINGEQIEFFKGLSQTYLWPETTFLRKNKQESIALDSEYIINPEYSSVVGGRYNYHSLDDFFRYSHILSQGLPFSCPDEVNNLDNREMCELLPAGYISYSYPDKLNAFGTKPHESFKSLQARRNDKSYIPFEKKSLVLDNLSREDFVSAYLNEKFNKTNTNPKFNWFYYNDTRLRFVAYPSHYLAKLRYKIALYRMSPSVGKVNESSALDLPLVSSRELVDEVFSMYNNISLGESKEVLEILEEKSMAGIRPLDTLNSFYWPESEPLGNVGVYLQGDPLLIFDRTFDLVSSQVLTRGQVINTSNLYEDTNEILLVTFEDIKSLSDRGLPDPVLLFRPLLREFSENCKDKNRFIFRDSLNKMDAIFEEFLSDMVITDYNNSTNLLDTFEAKQSEDYKNNQIKSYTYKYSLSSDETKIGYIDDEGIVKDVYLKSEKIDKFRTLQEEYLDETTAGLFREDKTCYDLTEAFE